MTNIAHAGTTLTIAASKTTNGVPLPIEGFPKDTDPVSSDTITIGGMEIGTNGDAATWSETNAVPITIAVYPGSPGSILLQSIFNADRVEKGKRSANNVITLNRALPNGAVLAATEGKTISYSPVKTQQSSGRLATESYVIHFAKVTEYPPVLALL